jgi:hypothetical protein
MTPAECLMKLYNAIPAPDRDGDGKPDLWEREMSLETAEALIAMADGGDIDVICGRVLRVSVPKMCDGTETYAAYDKANGKGAARKALKS